MRIEKDFLGQVEVPNDVYYGVQTIRALQNFNVTGLKLGKYPNLPRAFAMVKWSATKANKSLGLVYPDVADAICQACEEIIEGNLHNNFVVDMIQGGAGTSTNMNANEVIANRALEILGKNRGEYEFCHPNDDVNCSQSTNDVYPTAVKIAIVFICHDLIDELKQAIKSFRNKGREFQNIIKMGRTQLQDAVPMTLGQEFEAFAATLEEEIKRINTNISLFHEVNMGATAIGTGITADPRYSDLCINYLSEITGLEIVKAANFIEATSDTGAFIMVSSALKRLSIKLSKISSDLRLLSSGPRCGINEINLPPLQPGSTIMPGKVNPVIPELINQICYRVIGNDLTVTLAAEAGQLQLNVMEPVIVYAIIESAKMLDNGMETLRKLCVDGITANAEHAEDMVRNSIGIVTALKSSLGYDISASLAKEALKTNNSIYNLVLEKSLMSQEELDKALSPSNMTQPIPLPKKKPRE